MDRYASELFAEGPASPSSILASRADPRQLAAETILRMYLKERSGDLLVLLSELQVGRSGCSTGRCASHQACNHAACDALLA